MPDGVKVPPPWWRFWNIFDTGRRRGQPDPLEMVRQRIARQLAEAGPQLPEPLPLTAGLPGALGLAAQMGQTRPLGLAGARQLAEAEEPQMLAEQERLRTQTAATPLQTLTAPLSVYGQAVEPIAPLATLGVQKLIPGQQEVERRFQEKRQQGRPLIEAAVEAFQESDMPSAEFWLPFKVPLPFGKKFQRFEMGVKGAIELATDPINVAFGAGPAVRGTRLLMRQAQAAAPEAFKVARMGAAEVLTRVPQRQVQAAGLRVAGIPKVAGAAKKAEIGIGDVITTKLKPIGAEPTIGQVVGEGLVGKNIGPGGKGIPVWRIQTGPGKFEAIPKDGAEILAKKLAPKAAAVTLRTRPRVRPKAQPAAEAPAVAQPAGAAKEPWQMAKAEFEAEFWFHGKPTNHPLYKQDKITGGITQNWGVSQGYATQKGDIQLIREGNLPLITRGRIKAQTANEPLLRGNVTLGQRAIKPSTVLGVGRVPAKAEYNIPASVADPHRYLVEKAFSEGKPVPDSVLVDYPDLGVIGKTDLARAVPTQPVAPVAERAAPPAEVVEALQPKGQPEIPAAAQGPAREIPQVTEAVTPPVSEPSRAKPPVQPPGGKPPTAVGAGGDMPLEPPSGRPRTLLDIHREAKGMRAMTPEERASLTDVMRPIPEDEIIYRPRSFAEHERLLGADSGFNKALRRIPGAKQIKAIENPAQMRRDNPIALIGLKKMIFQEVEKSRARIATLRLWHDMDEFFAFKRTVAETRARVGPVPLWKHQEWKATKVKPAPGVNPQTARFGTLDDLLEHSERYILTPDQQRTLRIGTNTQTALLRQAQQLGVDAVEIGENYWHRIVLSGPKEKQSGLFITKRLGSRKGYTHQRAFEDVEVGRELGWVYETDPRIRFQSRLEAGIDTIADALARREIKSLPGVESPLERLATRAPELLETASAARTARDAAKKAYLGARTPENLMALRQSEANLVTALRDVYTKRTELGQAGWYELRLPNGRIAPKELVEEVEKYISLPELRQQTDKTMAVMNDIAQAFRSTLTNVDLAAGFIQGQSLFYRNHIAWWKSQARAIVALVDDPHAFIAKNFDLIDEGVRAGAISPPTEFLFTRQGIASIPTRIPIIGRGMRSFNRAFEWFIFSGQTELYKAGRGRIIGLNGKALSDVGVWDDLVSLGTAIRKEVGTESYAILGVRPTQQTLEAISAFAARFLRANVGILGQSFTKGAGGAEARKAMGALIAGGLSLTIGVTWALNKKMPNIADPYAPDWMQWKWGKTYYNAYGPFYSYFRTVARVSKSMAEGDVLMAGREMRRFTESKAGLPYRFLKIMGQLAFWGKAYSYGNVIEKTPLGILRGLTEEFATPISIGEIQEAWEQGRPEAVLELIGLVGRPDWEVIARRGEAAPGLGKLQRGWRTEGQQPLQLQRGWR